MISTRNAELCSPNQLAKTKNIYIILYYLYKDVFTV